MKAFERYRNLRVEGIEKTIKLETEAVNKTIAEIELTAKYFALSGRLCYEAHLKSLCENQVVEYLGGFPVAVGGGFWFAPYAYDKTELRTGFYAFYDKSIGKVRLDDTFFMDKYDYHNSSWYHEIADNVARENQVIWTKPYIDDSGSLSLMTTAGSGIFDENGNLMAISTVDWKIEKIIDKLSAIKPTEKSFVLLYSPEKNYIITNTYTNSKMGDSLKSISWDINAASFKLDGISYLSFDRTMDNGWILSVKIPRKEIFADGEKGRRYFLWMLAITAAINVFIAYFLVSRLINKPLKQLTSEVSKLAFGHLDTRIEMKSKSELGLLAETFNKMASDLQDAIETNARERAEKERIDTELGVATQIQASMLPCIFPPFPDRHEFDIYASMLPAKEVGGDFYDFFFVDCNTLAVVIADVSGKGVPAALFMVIAKTLIKNNACSGKKPKEVFRIVNNVLNENNDAFMFVTAFMGYYDITSGKFVYVNAGHNPPLVKKRGDGYEFLKTEPHFFLAWNKDTQYSEEEIILHCGDVLYLYTDGVTEALNKDNELFSEQRLLEALNRYGDYLPRELLPAVKQEVDSFAGETEQADDITMLALKVNTITERYAKKLEVEADIENLDAVLDFINAELLNCPQELRNDIDVAVEEIFVNIANYAYKPDKGDVAVYISTRQKISIKFEDKGRAYNPLEQDEPDLDKPLMERKIGGLGVFLVKKLMDDIEYARIENKNILIMTKNNL
jgi:sigma-B regulation protein RsbU (phosphoserine phosphatase)